MKCHKTYRDNLRPIMTDYLPSFGILPSYRNLQERSSGIGPSLSVRAGKAVVLVNRVFVPCQKSGHFDENGQNDAFYPLKTRALLNPENDESDENGRCHSGKGMV